MKAASSISLYLETDTDFRHTLLVEGAKKTGQIHGRGHRLFECRRIKECGVILTASSGDERQSSRDGGLGRMFIFRRALYDVRSCLKFIWLATLGPF